MSQNYPQNRPPSDDRETDSFTTKEAVERLESQPAAQSFTMSAVPEPCGALLEALGVARAAMAPVVEDTTGQFKNRSFKYADLAAIYKSAIPALRAQGITVSHPNCQVGPFIQRAITILSGHGGILSVHHDYPGHITDSNVKGFGKILTYLNRYQIRGLVAVAGEEDADNDGSVGNQPFNDKPAAPPQQQQRRQPPPAQRAASPKPPPQAPPPEAAPQSQPERAPEPARVVEPVDPGPVDVESADPKTGEVAPPGPASDATRDLLTQRMRAAGIKKLKTAVTVFLQHADKESLDDFTEAEALALIDKINAGHVKGSDQ
jgi:hypothetical protein